MRKRTSAIKRKMARNMRRNMTRPERVLWGRLRDSQLGTRFFTQRLACGYILDFYAPEFKLCVETDGPCHLTRKAYDAKRDMILKLRRGITTLRFTDQEVYNNLPAVVALIVARLK